MVMTRYPYAKQAPGQQAHLGGRPVVGTAIGSFILNLFTQQCCQLTAGLSLGLLIDEQVCSLHVKTVVSAVVSAIKLLV